MLIVETIAKIRRLYYAEQKGFKTIAKELGLSKNTVKKLIRQERTVATYKRSQSHQPALGSYSHYLETWLEEDGKVARRYRRTIKKLFLALQGKGYLGSYDAVHAWISRWRQQQAVASNHVFVPLEFMPGEAFQFDWSEETIKLAGKLVPIKVAHIRLCYSRLFLMVAYPNEQLEMVMDAHRAAFSFWGGVCRKGIYDNMKTAVQVVLTGKERVFNARFLQMCSHYVFEPVACTPASGWEKGQVENQVHVGRCNFFVPIPVVDSLEDLNAHLAEACLAWAKRMVHPEFKDKTVWDVYEQEKASLLPYRSAFDSYKVNHCVVSPYSLVQYETNSYSVDCAFVGKAVEVRIYAQRIKLFYQEQIIGEHQRCFERYRKLYNPWHYVSALERKPGALRNGAPFKQLQLPSAMQKLREQLSHYSDGDKRFIRILLQVTTYGLVTVADACDKALEQGGLDVMVDYYLQAVAPIREVTSDYPPLATAPHADCQVYNQTYLPTYGKEVSHA